MDQARQQIVDSIKENSNILVTVSANPSVDELSAALGLALLLDRLDKRATAVVSGTLPQAVKFLEPDKTFEDSADSLRDFIIALDKEKADHLRYKVEGDVVKIFITPYKTTLTQNDLDFSQGDYNVEMVLAIGVTDQGNLDAALSAHGKILHDATVATITAGKNSSTLGTIDWHNPTASSVSEMVASLADGLKGDRALLDEQISTALLTGIVSATDRFSNDRTTSEVMTMAAQLMAAGANQQLIAAKLEEAHDIAPVSEPVKKDGNNADKVSSDGTELIIDRDDRKPKEEPVAAVAAPAPEALVETPAAAPLSTETKDQLELEKQLAGIGAPTTAPAGTMQDIEKQLQDAVAETTPATEPAPTGPEAPLTAATDTAMPGFEPTPPVAPVSPFATEPAPLGAVESPQIADVHAPVAPVEPASPINSIQDNPMEGEAATVDPFSQPFSVPPAAAPLGGTSEGAAILSANEPIESIAPPPLQPAAESPFEPAPVGPTEIIEPVAAMPILPPLPPLPSDAGLPPLPPPPPAPNFGQGGPLPSGAVSADQLGNIFGDQRPEQPPAAPKPPEPGQFKIPGQ
jgi:hypothetical protein